ncbi:MAG: cytochrome P450 [Mariniblastus sp.]|jgi:cytochrome P450
MSTTNLQNVNIAAREHKANPHPFYARLRAEHPVHPVILPDKRTIWLVTRYHDVVEVLKDERFVKNPANVCSRYNPTRQPWMPRFAQPLVSHMLNKDKPDHARLRGLVNKAFSPGMVEQMRTRIQSVTTELLERVQGQSKIDLISDYALAIPTTVIAEMMGVPAKDRSKFNHWTNAVMQVTTTRFGMLKAIPNVWAFVRYLRNFIRLRQREPQDDLVSELVKAEVDGQRLNEDELVGMVFLLLVAGHETTVNLIGNGVLALLEHPQQMELLRNNPALIKPAVEELLRYGSPVEMGTERYAREDLTIAGVKIPGGSLVGVVLASANRDESQFPNPDSLDITRTPNKHLAFGLGTHYCTGAPLARLEGQIAISTLLQMVPQLQLDAAPHALRWRLGLITRGLESLPIAVKRWLD